MSSLNPLLHFATLDNANPMTLHDNGKYAVIYFLEDTAPGEHERSVYEVHAGKKHLTFRSCTLINIELTKYMQVRIENTYVISARTFVEALVSWVQVCMHACMCINLRCI